jgi:hypothetical protein
MKTTVTLWCKLTNLTHGQETEVLCCNSKYITEFDQRIFRIIALYRYKTGKLLEQTKVPIDNKSSLNQSSTDTDDLPQQRKYRLLGA